MSLEIVSAILSSVGAGASLNILKYLYEKFVDQREELPTRIESELDIQKVQLAMDKERKSLDNGVAEKIALGAIENTYSHLEGIRSERLRQARTVFNIALSLIVVGVLIIFAGVVLMYFQKTTAGIISSAVGVVTEIISAVLFKFNKEANDRLDALAPDLTVLERARHGMKFIEEIKDPDARNKAIKSLLDDISIKPFKNDV